MKDKQLRVLLVEDSEDDAYLLVRALERGPYEIVHQRVETPEDMEKALSEPWDLVLSDHTLPRFSGLAALQMLHELGHDLPFIMVSGTIGEDAAVEAFKAGAHDFLAKGRLARLMPAIERELREAAMRRDRRRVEIALAASELRYRRIVETTREGIVMTDAQGAVVFVNPRMAEMLGMGVQEIYGRMFADFIGERSLDARPFEGRWHGKAEQQELQVRRKDGSPIWTSVSVSAILDAQGSYDGALATLADINGQRQMRAQLMVTDRMASVGTLAAGVGHEINNPLAAAIANLQLAQEQLAQTQNTELLEMLHDCGDALERVRVIVRDLRILARGEEDTRGAVDLTAVVESSLRMAGNEIRHRAKLVKHLEPVPPVDGNESRLGQVLLNLLVNAAQAIGEGRADANEICVSTKLEDDFVHVIIRDSGPGIPPEVVPRLFQPFYTTKPVGEGTGLGLAICHRIVTELGGTITVDSVVGKGTTFTVKLRVARGPSVKAVSAAPVRSQASKRGRILVIDDEEMVGNVVRRSLSAEHDVVTTVRAAEGLELIEAGSFDLILCDLMMPQMTGMEFHQILSERHPEYAERVVFVTGGAFTPQTAEFLQSLSRPYVEKPFSPERLRALVNGRIR